MNVYDSKLTELVKMQMAGATLPAHVVIDGERVDTRRFVDRFELDRREAWESIGRLVHHVVERPLVCEIAGSLRT